MRPDDATFWKCRVACVCKKTISPSSEGAVLVRVLARLRPSGPGSSASSSSAGPHDILETSFSVAFFAAFSTTTLLSYRVLPSQW